MTVQVMLISPAFNAALREARFDGDAPLDAAGVRQARAAAAAVPEADRCVRGPSERCAGTADALGLRAKPELALRGWDMGRWSGQRLATVSGSEPDAVAAWMTHPSAAPHGGESLLEFCARVGRLLDSLESRDGNRGGRVLGVVEPAVVRAVIVRALALPAEAFWRLDVAPLTLTGLSGRSGRWNLRCGQPLSPAPGTGSSRSAAMPWTN
ncbi:histidine phosphatase family protein [Streptomyces sp. NBC_00846]|uniref:histidine phosphatase family protein n=1 Tax=Streptomyces sp. NBC_00846 TaxID=2975849 RepID=UPI00386EC09F|nr:histidine phosphatase family protein [Streptomyces sp. NBC_00846]